MKLVKLLSVVALMLSMSVGVAQAMTDHAEAATKHFDKSMKEATEEINHLNDKVAKMMEVCKEAKANQTVCSDKKYTEYYVLTQQAERPDYSKK